MEIGDIIRLNKKNWILESITSIDDEKDVLIFTETNLIALPIKPKQEKVAFQEGGHHFVNICGVKYSVELDESLKPGEWYIKGRGK